ncbi:MAG: hypothetical protein AAF810_04995 [Cyanobacteria bacterium P01_D01_bin.36]
MNRPQNHRSRHQHYSHTENLSPLYLRLEGFVENPPQAKKESANHKITIANPSHQQEDTWQDTVVTLSVMIVLLVGSSVALGVGASKLTEGLQNLTTYTQQQVNRSTSPTSWRF